MDILNNITGILIYISTLSLLSPVKRVGIGTHIATVRPFVNEDKEDLDWLSPIGIQVIGCVGCRVAIECFVLKVKMYIIMRFTTLFALFPIFK